MLENPHTFLMKTGSKLKSAIHIQKVKQNVINQFVNL